MKQAIIITCTSFTVEILFFSLFSGYDLAPAVSNRIALETFIMSLSIALLMWIFDRIQEHFDKSPLWLDILIRVFICYLVVFFQGSFFGMFDFSWHSLLLITPVLLPAFLITYVVSYITYMKWADEINKNIKRKNKS